MNTLRYPAPAKLNLFLHVIGRRADGYHLLQSAFRFIDLCDYLEFAPRDDGQIILTHPLPAVPVEHDLCFRAARLLQSTAGVRQGVEITLEKHLPMGGGLGGGSSDAATTLMVLNDLWKTGLTRTELMRLGLQLGADVPVFIFGGNAWAEGVGEDLQPIPLDPAWYVVLQPPVNVPTAVVFGAPELTRNTLPVKIPGFSAGQSYIALGNDLESVVIARFPAVKQHLEWLQQFGEARMTGSGSCVFAEFGTVQEAQAVLAQKPPEFIGFVAQGLTQHPLKDLGKDLGGNT